MTKLAYILLGGVPIAAFAFSQVQNTSTLGKARIQQVFELFDIRVSQNEIIFKRSFEVKNSPRVSYYVKKNSIEYTVNYSPESGFLSINSGLDFLRAKEPFAGSVRKWRTDPELRAAMQNIFRGLSGGSPGQMIECVSTEDKPRNGLSAGTQPGLINASYELLFDGSPYVDAFRGFRVKLATRDGAIVRVSGNLNGPPRGARQDSLGVAPAFELAKKKLSRPGLLTEFQVRKGWATPAGSNVAVIAYSFKRLNAASASPPIFVESKANGRVWTRN